MTRFAPSPDFDPRVADWLEGDPDLAPEQVLETVLAALPSIQQRPAASLPWRFRQMTLTVRLAAAAIAIAVLAVGGALLLRPGGSNVGTTPSPSTTTAPSPSIIRPVSPSVPAAAVDYSALRGRILMEHAGNAPDGSEPANGDYHIDRRRFYWMEPATMTGATAVEFLKGQPASGKVAGAISPDQTKIVFQDADQSGEFLWTANLDGTSLRKVATTCPVAPCRDLEPAFDPTGTKVVFVRVQETRAFLMIKDLVSGQQIVLTSTQRPNDNDVPERPSWSPDGEKIAFGRIHWKSEGVPESGAIYVTDVATDKTAQISIAGLIYPGNPHWSPDGSRILLLDGPLSMAPVPFGDPNRTGDIYTVAPDGSNLKRLTHMNGVVAADYTPDGQHVFFFDNYFWMMNLDGSAPKPVNARGDDLSELEVGFAYVGHWINNPPTP